MSPGGDARFFAGGLTLDIRWVGNKEVRAMVVAEFPTLAVNIFAVVVVGVVAVAAWLSLRPKHQ
jgi:hypothetical protein